MLELIFVNISKRPCKLLIYMDRESDFQSVGREFESRRTHQRTQGPVAIRGLFPCYLRSSKSGVQAAFSWPLCGFFCQPTQRHFSASSLPDGCTASCSRQTCAPARRPWCTDPRRCWSSRWLCCAAGHAAGAWL